MRIKIWLTRTLLWGLTVGSLFLLALERISEVDILLDPPLWLKSSFGLLLKHWKSIGLALVATVAILLMLRGYRSHVARSRARTEFPVLTEHLKRIEVQIAAYEQSWKSIESLVNDPRFHWPKKVGPWWPEAVGRLDAAYQEFEDLSEELFVRKPALPSLAQMVPPEASHVRPDIVRQQFKQLWLMHQRRMAAINEFRKFWNSRLAEAVMVLKQDIKRAAPADYHRQPSEDT